MLTVNQPVSRRGNTSAALTPPFVDHVTGVLVLLASSLNCVLAQSCDYEIFRLILPWKSLFPLEIAQLFTFDQSFEHFWGHLLTDRASSQGIPFVE